jgi:hypothetical protein
MMARITKGAKLAGLNPGGAKIRTRKQIAEWTKMLSHFADGEFADDPEAKLVRDWMFTFLKKPVLSAEVWQMARAMPHAQRLHIIPDTTQPAEIRMAAQYLDAESHYMSTFTQGTADALRRGDAKFFKRIAVAVEWYSQKGAEPVDRIRLVLQFQLPYAAKKRQTLNELSASLKRGGIAHTKDSLRRICREMKYPIRKLKGGRPRGSKSIRH